MAAQPQKLEILIAELVARFIWYNRMVTEAIV